MDEWMDALEGRGDALSLSQLERAARGLLPASWPVFPELQRQTTAHTHTDREYRVAN